MGCSHGTVLMNSNNLKDLNLHNKNLIEYPYKEREKKYSLSKEYFFSIFDNEAMETIKQISDGPADRINDSIKTFWKDKKHDITKHKKIVKEDFEDFVLLELSREFLQNKQSTIIKEHDIFIYILSKIRKHILLKRENKNEKLTDKEFNWFSSFLEEIEINIPSKQKVVNIFIDKSFSLTKYFKTTLYEHFLFEDEFKPESINILFTPLLFKNPEIIALIAEIIKRKPLNFINIIIHPIEFKNESSFIDFFNFDSDMYGKLLVLLTALKSNSGIKLFSLSISKSAKIVLPPELSNIILEFIKLDNLIGLWLGKFYFSNEFYTQLSNILANVKKLQFLGLNTEFIGEIGINGINNILSSNKSIKGIILTGVNYVIFPNSLENLKVEITNNKRIEMFYFNKNKLNIENIETEEPPQSGGEFLG